MPLPLPAVASTDRLRQRLPLLEALAKGGKVHKAAIEKVLATIERDLATLADEKELAKLPDASRGKASHTRQKAVRTRDEVKAQVEKLKAMLDKKD